MGKPNIVIHVDHTELDAALEKVKQLIEALKEAKSLADDVAPLGISLG